MARLLVTRLYIGLTPWAAAEKPARVDLKSLYFSIF